MLTVTYSLLHNFCNFFNSKSISGNIVCDCILGSASGLSTTIIIIVVVVCVVVVILIGTCCVIIFVMRQKNDREREMPYDIAMDANARDSDRVNAESIEVVTSRKGRHYCPNCAYEVPAVAWSRGKEFIPRHDQYPRGGNGYPYYVQPRIYNYHVPANKRHYPSSYISTASRPC